MTLPNLAALRNARRPTLRMQLTLLYAGLFVALVAAVLLASGFLVGQSSRGVLVPGSPGQGSGNAASGHQFDVGPAIVGLVAVLVAVAGAWWLAGRILRPLREMTTTAREISATNLHRRLDLAGPNDELTELGRTLDGLLGRLEASFEAQRRFVANASHELRTPLAGQRTLLQVALADPEASAESLRSACEEALQLGDHQEQLIDALLTLATSQQGVEAWERADLARIAGSVVDGRRQEAELRGIRIDIALADAPVSGAPRLIELLVANLVDNALRHNRSGGTVEVSTTATPERSTVLVGNTGPAVAPEEVERLLQPFQHGGRDRVRRNDGHGFGLAIVQAVVTAHGAAITARARPGGGLDVEVSFPAG